MSEESTALSIKAGVSSQSGNQVFTPGLGGSDGAGEVGAEFVGVEAVGEGGVAIDAAELDEFGEGLVHGHHAFGFAGGDEGAHLVVLAGADEIADGGGGDHDFDRGVEAGVADGGDELLRDDREQGEGELLAKLGLVAGGEAVEDAGHGLGGVVGVERGEDEVTGFGGGERGGHGFGVAHFADEDDVGVLAEDGADGLGEGGRVVADLDLLHDGIAVGVLVLDGIFDGDDVVAAAGVDDVDEGGHGGGFAAAGGAGEQDQALLALHKAGEDGREVEGFEGGDLRREETDAGGERAALIVEVGAEAADGAAEEAEVEGAFGFEFLSVGRGEERQEHGAKFVGGERLAGGEGEGAVDAEGDRCAGYEDDVGCALFDGESEQLVERGSLIRLDFGRGAIELVDDLREIAFVG